MEILMKHLLIALFLAMTCISAGGCFSSQAPVETRYADRTNMCSVAACDPWKRHESAEKASLVITLRLSYGERIPEFTPKFVVSVAAEYEARVPIDEAAKGFIKQAKEALPNQGDTGAITTVKLDGEDARQFAFLRKDKSRTLRFFTVLARHSGKLVVVQIICDDAETSQMLPQGQTVLKTFKWLP